MQTTKTKRTKIDGKGRVWIYCDGEGCWCHERHIIGRGAKNGSKWQVWNGPNSGFHEFRTLSNAMNFCTAEME